MAPYRRHRRGMAAERCRRRCSGGRDTEAEANDGEHLDGTAPAPCQTGRARGPGTGPQIQRRDLRASKLTAIRRNSGTDGTETGPPGERRPERRDYMCIGQKKGQNACQNQSESIGGCTHYFRPYFKLETWFLYVVKICSKNGIEKNMKTQES